MVESWINKLYCRDNLIVIKEYVSDESIDLIYLDLPIKHRENIKITENDVENNWYFDMDDEIAYNYIITQGPIMLSNLFLVFRNIFGINKTMVFLIKAAVLLIELYRVLKPTGSIYLHCNATLSHYLKLILDALFGIQQYRNEVIWCYDNNWDNREQKLKTFIKCHDVLLFYTKSDEYIFNLNLLEVSGIGEDGEKFKCSKYEDVSGKIHIIGRLVPDMSISTFSNMCLDYWNVNSINKNSKEYLNYFGQKPEALLENIIKVSSNNGDVVLDPFCGSGTTIVVAEDLNRSWIGIDISQEAINITNKRLMLNFGVLGGG